MPKSHYDFLVSPRLPSGANLNLIIATLRTEAEKQYVQWVAKRIPLPPSVISMTARLEPSGKGDLIQRCTVAEAALELIAKQHENSLVLLKVFNMLEELGPNTKLVDFSRAALQAQHEIRNLIKKRMEDEYAHG